MPQQASISNQAPIIRRRQTTMILSTPHPKATTNSMLRHASEQPDPPESAADRHVTTPFQVKGPHAPTRRTLDYIASVALAVGLAMAAPTSSLASAACPALLNHSIPRLQDEVPQNLCQYAGKVVLVVNTASKCGFTSQYEGLEKLYDRYRNAGLVVLGFPSGDFGGQELSTNKEIAEFCSNTFAVRFPMLVKSSVRGKEANPVFAGLIRESGTAPKWNFYKYLIGRDGRLVKVYSSFTAPDEAAFVQDVERSLKKGS